MEGLNLSPLTGAAPALRALPSPAFTLPGQPQEEWPPEALVWTEEHHAVYSHLLMCDTRGSDIRLLPQQLWRPHQWPRQCVDTRAWQWRTEQSYSFDLSEHINALECRALFNFVRRRACDPVQHRSRWLHILDSQVTQSAAAKGRSSAQSLNRILKRLAGLLVAANLYPYYAWTRSELNPSDAPSRGRPPS